jgi:hypothetical protein
MAISPDGRGLAAGASWRDGWCGESTLEVMGVEQPFMFSLPTSTFGGATAPVWLDDRTLAIGGFDTGGWLGIANRDTVPEEAEVLHLENARIEPVARQSDGRLLVRVRAWQIEGGWTASSFDPNVDPALDRLYLADLQTGRLEPTALPTARSVTPLRSL